MLNTKFDAWCDAATARIRYWGDRDAVSAELRAHLEDRYDALVEAGYSHAEATATALESMGSAQEIAPQLGAIHRPWLGWLYSFVKFVGITSGVLAVFAVSFYLWTSMGSIVNWSGLAYLPRNLENISYYCEPELSAVADGYRFSINEVAVSEENGETTLHYLIETKWWPWMKSTRVQGEFWAVDSLGNYYYPYSDLAYESPHIVRNGGFESSWSSRWSMALMKFDPDAQWVEICYDRDGRNIVFRIDLTGGDAHE